MKKVQIILWVVVLLMTIGGCTADKNDPVNNALFTDAFFDDVVAIRCTMSEPVSGEQMKTVIRYLKSLTLVETDERIQTTDENGELLYGGYAALTFDKADGTEIWFNINNSVINCISGLDANYKLESGNTLLSGLKEAFVEALK